MRIAQPPKVTWLDRLRLRIKSFDVFDQKHRTICLKTSNFFSKNIDVFTPKVRCFSSIASSLSALVSYVMDTKKKVALASDFFLPFI